MTSEEFRRRLNARADAAGLRIGPELAELLEAYYRLLLVWNEKINLTALNVRELPDEAMDRLFVEPVAAAGRVDSGGRVLDVGSGGGSPAIPFALASGAAELTMVEARARKSVFLREAARVVGLSRAEVLTSRFEDVAESPDLQGRFDQITVRAVRIAAADWVRLRRLLRLGGSLLFLHRAGSSISADDGFAEIGTHPITSTAELTALKRIR